MALSKAVAFRVAQDTVELFDYFLGALCLPCSNLSQRQNGKIADLIILFVDQD